MENENYTEATFVFYADYWTPMGFDNTASDTPLYFVLNKTMGDYGQEEFELNEESTEVYDAYQPK